MNIVLWIVQALLALVYLAAGSMKALVPMATLSKSLPWTSSVSPALVRFIGVAELLGAIGLILPLATNILPWLTPTAAAGLIAVQLGAFGFHATRRETSNLPGNALLLLLAAFILIGRTVLIPA